jgi:hypothetical protein
LVAAEPDWAEQPPRDIEQDASPVAARETWVVFAGVFAGIFAGLVAAGVVTVFAGVAVLVVVGSPLVAEARGAVVSAGVPVVGTVSVCAASAPAWVLADPVHPVVSSAHWAVACARGPLWLVSSTSPVPVNAASAVDELSVNEVPVTGEPVVVGSVGVAEEVVVQPPMVLWQCAAPEASAAVFAAAAPPVVVLVAPSPLVSVLQEPAAVVQPAPARLGAAAVSVLTAQLPVQAPVDEVAAVDVGAGAGAVPVPVAVGSVVGCGVLEVAWQPPAPWHSVEAWVRAALE